MTNSMDMVNTNHQGGDNPRKIYATPISVTYNGLPSEFRDNSIHYMEGMFESDNQTGTVFIRISVPDLKLQKCLQFELDETVWQAKQRLLTIFSKDLKDAMNFGLYCPPMNGRAGKFLEEERFLREYPLQGPIGFLEFKYKRRVFKLMHVNPRRLKQLNTKGSQKHFMDYVKSCNVEKVTKLTNKGLDPNFHDSHSGETPLSVAVGLNKQKCRELIMSLAGGGAHLDYRTRKGMTTVHKAVLAGNTEALKTLLDLGVSPNLKDVRGLTPLFYCVSHNCNEECADMLLAERAVIGAQDEQGWFELHHACKQGLSQHLEHLLFYGADMEVKNSNGNTPLHIAALNNKENCARLLLFRGANKEAVNYSNQTPYESALISQNHELSLIIENYKQEDVVPYRELPKYSKRRRDSIPSSAMYGLFRSRSDPRVNIITSGEDVMYMSPSSSSNSLGYLNNNYPDTDSPCSMSVSSGASSGPGMDNRLSVLDFRLQNMYAESAINENSVLSRLNNPRIPQSGSVPFRSRSMYGGPPMTTRSVDFSPNTSSHIMATTASQDYQYGMVAQPCKKCGQSSLSKRSWPHSQSMYSAGVHSTRRLSTPEHNMTSSYSRLHMPHQHNSYKCDHRNIPSIFVNGNRQRNYSDSDHPCVMNDMCHSNLFVPQLNLMNPETMYVCIQPFLPKEPGHLPLQTGEIIEVTGVGDHGYWEGRNTSGQEGWFPSDHIQEVKLRRKAGSLGDLVKASRDTTLNRNTLATLTRSYNHHEARTVVLQRGKEGYGFVLRGAKSSSNATGELDFCPTAEFPALQYLDSVDPGSRSDRAGLKSGDFLLEINGENVVRATHDRVVQIIRQSGDTLKLKVVTVKPHSGQENWSHHNDGSMTLPSRGGKRQAPQPPKRDPQTSISLTKSQGKQIAEGMAELDSVQGSPLQNTDPIPTGSKTQQVDLSQTNSGSGTPVDHNDSRDLPKLGIDKFGSSQQVEPIYAKPLKRRLTHNKSFRAPLPPGFDEKTSVTKHKDVTNNTDSIATDQNIEPNKKSLKVPPVTAPKPNRKSVRAPAPPDQLDKALDEYDMQGEVTQEQKTASIRSRHSAKRVSLVDVSSLEGEQGQDKYMSPSEIRIKKYHHSKKQNGAVSVIERSKSTSDLLDGKKSEPVYATPVAVPGKATSKHQRSASGSGDITDKYDYDLSDNVSLKSSASYGGSTGKLASPTSERPKAPPPPPPGGTLPRRQAPPPPKGVEPILAAKTELVSISTNRKSTTIYATPAEVVPTSSTKTQDDSDYESSFRPGNSAKLSDEPKIKTKSLEEVKLKSHQRNASASSRRSEVSEASQLSEGSDKPSVSFAEDKVFDNAKSFLQKHPNAQLLVTADIHTSKQHSEPAPDYDFSDEDSPKSPSGVTVISIGDRKQSTNASKLYTVRHSDIPESPQMKDTEKKKEVVIPPPPSEPAPKPPVTKTVHSASPVTRPPPTSEEVKVTVVSTERMVDPKVEPQVVPPAPAPPPPPPPPVVPVEENKTPVILRKTPEPQGNIVIPTGDIMAAVQKRQSRLQNEDLKITPVPERKVQIDTQAALLAAVAKRRTALLKKSDTAVVDEIEQRLNKSKKLQAAKYTFSSENMKKESKPETKTVEEQKSKVPLKVSPKTEVKASVEKDVTTTSSKTVTSTMKPIFNSTSSTTVNSNTTMAKMTVTSTASKTQVENKDILTTSKTRVESKDKAEEKEPAKVKSSLSSDRLSGQQQSAKDRVKDFLAEAEKAREEWLKKRSSTSSLRPSSSENLNNVTIKSETSQSTTVNGSRKISAPPESTKKFPAPTPNMNSRSTSVSSKTTAPIFTSEKIVINTKTVDKAKVNGVERTPSSVTQPVQKKSDALGIEPVRGRDTELTTNKTSIKDRIANFEKNNKSGIVNGRGRSTSPMSPRYPIHGVTTDSSATDVKKNSTLPPPPGFGDMVQVDIIPPPTSFQPQQDHDAASVVSSLSTLSTLSDEHADSGYSPSKHSYEEVIPPPPPGFDDSNDLGYDEIPTVIPPPPIFDSNENNNKVIKTSVGLSNVNKPFSSKSVDTWQCLDVLDWLDSLNMPQYKTSFQKHCIDGKKLVGLSRNDYIELGVTQVGHRMNLERCIKKATIQKS